TMLEQCLREEFLELKSKDDEDGNFYKKNSITKKILFFGRLHEYKGISVLLDAMPIVKEKDSDIVLNIVGNGIISNSDNEKIKKLGSSCNVKNKYIPNEEIYKYFEDVDFVVVPYIEASQSGVVMLAYAFGKPVIATDIGGLPEQVFEDTGIIIQPNDRIALANSILEMYENPSKIFEMGKAAELKNGTLFSWETSANSLLNFL
ncbi:MAG: glycosyltransferase family 4 protein, partial [Treponemataceae bacterium]|nr:glycosyltransferase family 4 protein [Treponemataceae bacterium]